jgi:hypothetical protein
MRRLQGRGLNFGTSPERIAPESLTLRFSRFVHRNISRPDQHAATKSRSDKINKGGYFSEIMNPQGHE